MGVTILHLAMRPMADRDTNAHDLAKPLGICTYTVLARSRNRPEATRRGPRHDRIDR